MPATRLEDLDIGLLALIFEFVDDSSPGSTISLAAVNRVFYATAKLVRQRYKTVQCQCQNTLAVKTLTRWLSDDEALRRIHHLTVHGALGTRGCEGYGRKPEGSSGPPWDLLVSLIEKLGRLRTLSWYCSEPVPISVLEALEKYQKGASLKVYNWTRIRATDDENVPEEIALAQCRALTVLKARIWTGGGDRHPDLRKIAFKRIVASAPNLKEISMSTGHFGCVVKGYTMENIKELDAKAAKFKAGLRPNPAVKKLNFEGMFLGESTIKHWSDFVDMGELESFTSDQGRVEDSFYEVAATKLDKLKQVTVNIEGEVSKSQTTPATCYLLTCSPLQSLSICGWSKGVPLPTILERHGATLKTLSLRERENSDHNQNTPRRTPSVEELVLIKTRCPGLRDLTIDLNRHSEELDVNDHSAVFDTLVDMKLDRLQMYFDLGLSYLATTPMRRRNFEGTCLRPSESKHIEPFVIEIWRRIFGAVRVGDRALDVKFGEWEAEMGGGLPASWVCEMHHLRSFWTVRPQQRDDCLDKCTVNGYPRAR